MNTVLRISAITIAIFWIVVTTPATAEMKSVTLGVRMSCPFCSYNVRRTLTALPGVIGADVSLRKQTAVVTFDDSVTDVDALAGATEGIGYQTTILSTAGESLSNLETPAMNRRTDVEETKNLQEYINRLLFGVDEKPRNTQWKGSTR